MTMCAERDEQMPYRTADTRDMVLANRVFRRLHRYLAAVAPRVRPGDLAAAATVADFFGELAAALRDHHATEAELLWPVLLGYLAAADRPDQAARVIIIADQQRAVRQATADLVPVLGRFRATATAADRDRVVDLLGRLRVVLE